MISTILSRAKNIITYLKRYKDRADYEIPDNKNIINDIHIERVYRKMEQQFADTISNGVVSDVPIRSNKVWICWFQGEENAPDLVRACINAARKYLLDREIIILDEKSISNFVQLPDYIIEKRKAGIISAAHYSDILRTELLCKYGGIWMDATVLCTTSDIPKCIIDSPLFVYKSMKLSPVDRLATVSSSWFISAYSNQRILLLTRKLLYDYWKSANVLNNYFLFHIFFALAARRYPEDFSRIPMYNNHSPHTLHFELGDEYSIDRWNEIMKTSCFHKLNHHLDLQDSGNSNYQHILDLYL